MIFFLLDLQCNVTTSATIVILTSQERNYLVHVHCRYQSLYNDHKNLLGCHWILIPLETSEINTSE